MTKPPYRVPSMSDVAAVRGENGYRVVSTFSGCGGSCLGFEMAGFEVAFASEFIPAAADTYNLNHPGVPVSPQDIRELDANALLAYLGLRPGELDVLEGSPPCANFSTAGKREKAWGKVKKYSDREQRSDDLFFEYARLLKALQPKVFVAENVSGLVKGVAKGYFKLIHRALTDCGYEVECRLLDAQWLGVPQQRVRTIFVGVRNDLVAKHGVHPAYPKPKPHRYSLREALQLGRATTVQARVGGQNTRVTVDDPSPTVTANGIGGRSNRGEVDSGHIEEVVPVPVRVPSRRHEVNYDDRSPDAPAPTIMASGMGARHVDWDVEEELVPVEEAPEGQLFEVTPVRVIHDSSAGRDYFERGKVNDYSGGDVTDRPSPTITIGVGGLNSSHWIVEEEVVEPDRLIVRSGTEDGRDLVAKPLDEPAPTVMADGMASGNNRSQTWLETDVDESGLPLAPAEELAETTLEGTAIGREYDNLREGQGSDKYLNLIRADSDAPSPTVTATAGQRAAAGVAHPTQRRKFTIRELKAVCGFPADFELTGSYRQQWERLGRAVPPLMMREIAAAVRDEILEPIRRAEEEEAA